MPKSIAKVCGNIFSFFILALSAQSSNAQIIITEVLPNPDTGTSEFVELYNTDSHPIDLGGWKIDDDLSSGRNPKNISGTIYPGDYLVIYFDPNFAYFNNTGTDSANLLDPSSQLINSIEYEKDPPKNLSYSLINGLWGWTTPTPSAANQTSTQPQQTSPQQNDQTQNEQEQNINSKTPDQLNGIIITEALPNPTGDDAILEFIELFNTNNYSINVGGWQLDDADGGSRAYTLPPGTIIAPRTFIVFYSEDTKIALNNSGGDSIRLLRPDKSIADTIVYTDDAAEGLSYAKTEFSSWGWAEQPTPGETNIFERKEQPTSIAETKTPPFQKEPIITAPTHTSVASKQTLPTEEKLPKQTDQQKKQETKPGTPIASIVNISHPTTKPRPNNIVYAIVISAIAGFASILIRRKTKK